MTFIIFPLLCLTATSTPWHDAWHMVVTRAAIIESSVMPSTVLWAYHTHMLVFTFILWGWLYYYPHCIDEKLKTQSNLPEVPSQVKSGGAWGSNPSRPMSESVPFNRSAVWLPHKHSTSVTVERMSRCMDDVISSQISMSQLVVLWQHKA